MKISEVRELTDKELYERLESERAQLTQMRLNHAITPLDNPSQLKEARKTIARLLTEARQRELNKK